MGRLDKEALNEAVKSYGLEAAAITVEGVLEVADLMTKVHGIDNADRYQIAALLIQAMRV